jgi:hypothetical protein
MVEKGMRAWHILVALEFSKVRMLKDKNVLNLFVTVTNLHVKLYLCLDYQTCFM